MQKYRVPFPCPLSFKGEGWGLSTISDTHIEVAHSVSE
jgi:hypothetical protein